jgi:DNA polymerase III subunit delta'
MKRFECICPWLADTLGTLEAAAVGGRLGHGWLINGPRGVGKTNLAYVLADRLLNHLCGTPPPARATPEAVLADYAALAEGLDLHPDLHRVRAEEGKRTIAVEQIRDLKSELSLTAHLAGLKVVIIEQAERMTTEAANALLKSLEEPSADTYLFLLAERPGRLPATVRSRCQQIRLKVPSGELCRQWLVAGGLAPEALDETPEGQGPIATAALLADADNLISYKALQSDIDALYEGKSDAFTLGERWAKGDPEPALGCLIARLQATIRLRLVPGLSNRVTDPVERIAENSGSGIPTEALFAGLQMAENLREQLGRGINVDLALKALLLGLERPRA